MKTIQYFIAFLVITLLVGCAGITEVQKEVVTDTRTKVVFIPNTLLEKCPATTPPEQSTYVSGSDKERNEMLVSYSQDLLKDLAKCNNNISKIKKLQQDQQAIYDKTMEKH